MSFTEEDTPAQPSRDCPTGLLIALIDCDGGIRHQLASGKSALASIRGSMSGRIPPRIRSECWIEIAGRAGVSPAACCGFWSAPLFPMARHTLERRWGSKIKARGIYRDPVRSAHGHFVKASGLRWLSVMLLPDIPWAGRACGLPFLTDLWPPPSDMPSSISGDIRNSPTGPDRPCCRWRNGCLAGRLSRSPTAVTR